MINIFKKKIKEVAVIQEQVEVKVKKTELITGDFLKDFNQDSLVEDQKLRRRSNFRKREEDLKKTLSNSIIISLCEKVDRLDLQFLGASKIDGWYIYKYIGDDFSSFNLEYEEVISF